MNPAIILKPLGIVAERLLISILSEKALKWGFFRLAKWIAKSKKTPHALEYVKVVEEVYDEQSNRVETK